MVYEEDEIQEHEVLPTLSISGKLITENPIHRGFMQLTLANIWCNPYNLAIKEIDVGILIYYSKKEDHKRILRGKIWILINS